MFLTSTRLFFIVSSAMVDAYYKKERITTPCLAEMFNVSKRALTPSLNRLMKAGYLRSQTGGSKPGFIFAKDPVNISVIDVIHALEGEMRMAGCREILPEIKCEREHCDGCLLNRKVNALIEAGRRSLEKISLYDLYEDSRSRENLLGRISSL